MPADDRKQIAFVLYPGMNPSTRSDRSRPSPRCPHRPDRRGRCVGERTDAVRTDAVDKMAPSHTAAAPLYAGTSSQSVATAGPRVLITPPGRR